MCLLPYSQPYNREILIGLILHLHTRPVIRYLAPVLYRIYRFTSSLNSFNPVVPIKSALKLILRLYLSFWYVPRSSPLRKWFLHPIETSDVLSACYNCAQVRLLGEKWIDAKPFLASPESVLPSAVDTMGNADSPGATVTADPIVLARNAKLSARLQCSMESSGVAVADAWFPLKNSDCSNVAIQVDDDDPISTVDAIESFDSLLHQHLENHIMAAAAEEAAAVARDAEIALARAAQEEAAAQARQLAEAAALRASQLQTAHERTIRAKAVYKKAVVTLGNWALLWGLSKPGGAAQALCHVAALHRWRQRSLYGFIHRQVLSLYLQRMKSRGMPLPKRICARILYHSVARALIEWRVKWWLGTKYSSEEARGYSIRRITVSLTESFYHTPVLHFRDVSSLMLIEEKPPL